MFIAMNRFTITPGRGGDFETAWRTRESHLHEVPGFVRFALLRGDTPGEYISHTTWESRSAFEAWTKSEAFRAAHGGGIGEGVLAEHPRVAFYETLFEQEAAAPIHA